jgi:arginase family enzyme
MDAIGPRDSFRSPRFGQPPTFMRLPYIHDPSQLDVAIVGVPYDGATSYRPVRATARVTSAISPR